MRKGSPRTLFFRRFFARDRLIALALLGVLLAVYRADPAPIEILRVKLFDLLQAVQPRQVTQRPVTIVDIDEASLAEIGQWPWPRSTLARLVETLTAGGAVVVAFDVVFPESDRMNPAAVAETLGGLDPDTRRRLVDLPSNDQRFAQAIGNGRVVLGRGGAGAPRQYPSNVPLRKTIVVKRAAGAPGPEAFVVRAPALIRNIPVVEQAAAGHGLVSLFPEADGVVRRVPAVMEHAGDLYPALAVEMLRVALRGSAILVEIDGAGVSAVRLSKQIGLPTDRNGRVWPHFSKYDLDKYVPAKDVLAGTVDPARIRDRLIVVGTSAFGLHDIRSTPVERAMPGVEVHAQIIENALTGGFLSRPNFINAPEFGLLLFGGLLMIWMVPRMGARWSLVLFCLVAGGAFAVSWYLFSRERVLFDIGYSILAMLVLYTFLTYSGYASEEASRRRVRTAFAHYLSPAMVEKLAEDPSQLRLGGETRPMSILFCDVRGFTSISEGFKNDPEGLTGLINKLLTPLTAIILDRRGTVDKYMGDCIMAFWNAPLDDPDHARHACFAALEMQAAMAPLNERLAAEAAAGGRTHVPLAIGIGINSGEVVVGNMGSDQRFDYSVLGDDVNLASRLEGQSKVYGVGIVVGERTGAAAADLALLELDLIRVKGKREAARIFTVVGDETTRTGNAFPGLAEVHARMLAAYRRQQWDEVRSALTLCRQRMDDFDLAGLYDLYERRVGEYERTPPEPGWDGVYIAATK
jgi:adenylate cyclase